MSRHRGLGQDETTDTSLPLSFSGSTLPALTPALTQAGSDIGAGTMAFFGNLSAMDVFLIVAGIAMVNLLMSAVGEVKEASRRRTARKKRRRTAKEDYKAAGGWFAL